MRLRLFCLVLLSTALPFNPGWSQEQEPSIVAPKSGLFSQNESKEKNSTELGRYKAMVYRAIGSRWYSKVNKIYDILPVGSVHVQFTIHADGTVETKVLEGNNMQELISITIGAINEASPFPPFTKSMQAAIGDSYTDDYTFMIYKDPKPGTNIHSQISPSIKESEDTNPGVD